ncbi:hypothetical protein A6764_05765 [Brevibacillus sp. WF146]|uniref:hypothetical protein n=1 Tax=Brevibacillus sp. WF146 TaxID=319501 RepID=UPI002226C762|nr:hypothetical protein [Brevibacillus sp. WF146]UYZ14470.1 hypothetical protein A6764_05765 [Brevibacillus sp. WF146]
MPLRLLLALFLALLLPASAFAYSYGDPNKEDLAESFKEIAAKLEQTPEDWNGAHQAFLSRKNEIALEFGQQTAQTLEANFSQQNKDLVLHNYKALLVKNIDRRLTNAEQQFDDYAKAKLLLAKGRGTLNVLAPYISDSASKTAFAAFDKALAALGNPGLFGVGTVPSDKNEFQKQTKLIRSTLQPLFPWKGGTAAAAAGSQTSAPTASSPQTAPAGKPASTAQPSSGSPAGTKTKASASSPSGPQPSAAASGQQTPASGSLPAQTDASPAAPGQSPGQGESAAQASANPAGGQTDGQTAKPAPAGEGAQPAPSKVNPVVTASLMGGLIIVFGGLFWLAKRKKWI